MRKLLGSVVLLGGLTITTGALAQEANVGMALPGSAPAPATATTATTDHDQVVGRLAVGYLGRSTVGFGAGIDDYAETVEAPVVGIRYWLSPVIGLDAGLGFFSSGGSGETDDGMTTTSADLPSHLGFLVHAGLPIALASADHFTFEIIPELNVGIGSGSETDEATEVETTMNGFHLDVGARAGAEIHFGFMKLPQLSLQGSIGLLFALDSAKTTQELNGDSIETTGSRTIFTTTVGSNPWNIFTSNVAALYYF
jgi:hypothetical protein